jgi:hypothetical protein
VSNCQELLEHVFFGLFRPQLLQQLAFPFPYLAQLLRDRAQLLQHFPELLFQVRDFFFVFVRHILSIANKGLCEQYP